MGPIRRSRRAASRGRRGADDGVSLLETVVALGVLAAVALATAGGLMLSTKVSRTNAARVVAANLAAEHVEYLRSLGPLAVPVGEKAWPDVVVKGATYGIRTVSQWQSAPAGTDRCSGVSTGEDAFLKTTVLVRLPGDDARRREVRSDTILAPRGGTAPAGSVRMIVFDRENARFPGRTVTLEALAPLPSRTWTATTDSFGCVVFAGLADGRYRLLVDETGFVSTNGVRQFTETVSVDRLQPPPTVSFSYDRAGGVSLAFQNAATMARPDAVGMVLAHPGLRPLGAVSSAGTSLSGLFPFPSAYQGWLGRCEDADPAYTDGPRASVTVPPGGTATAAVPGGTATVVVRAFVRNGESTNGTFSSHSGATVRARNAACGQELTFLAPGGSSNAVTAADGRLALTLPFGTWQFRVDGICLKKEVPDWPTATFTPASSDRLVSIDVERRQCGI